MRAIVTAAALLACVGCQQKGTSAAAADAQSIDHAQRNQIAAISAKDLKGATSIYANDAIFIGDRGVPSRGRAAIVSIFKGVIADPTENIVYMPGPKVFSSSGDMAYSTASYTETYTDPATKKLVRMKGTNLSVWRKQADGTWRLVADSNPAGPAQ